MLRISIVVVMCVACSSKREDKVSTGSAPPAGRIEAQVYGAPSKDLRVDRLQISADGRVALVTKPGAPPTRIELGATVKLADVTTIPFKDAEDITMSADGATYAVVQREAITLVSGSTAIPVALPKDHVARRAAFTSDGGLVVMSIDDHGYRLLGYDAKHALRSDQRAFHTENGSDCTLALGSNSDVALIENCHGTRVFRVHDGALLAHLSPSGTSVSAGVAEVAPGQFAAAFVVGEDDRAFELWLPAGRRASRLKDVAPCALAPTGKLAACDHGDGEVIVFEPVSQTTRMRVHVPESVMTLRFTPDGTRLVMGLFDTRVAIADTSQAHASAPALPVGSPVLAIDPKQPTALDAPKRKLSPARTIELSDAAVSIVASPDNERLGVIGAMRGGLIVDLARPTSLLELFDISGGIHRPEMVWSPDGTQLAVVESEPKERLVVRSATDRETARDAAADIKETRVAWSSKGLVATGGPQYGTIQIWHASTLAKTRVLEPPDKQWLGGIAFAPDGRLASWGAWAPTVVWNTETGERVGELAAHAADLVWSRDGALVVTQGHDHAIIVWDGAKLAPLAVLRGADAFTLAISPDGKLLAGSDLSGITVWSLPDGKPLYRIEQEIVRPKILAWPGPLAVGTQTGLALFNLPSR